MGRDSPKHEILIWKDFIHERVESTRLSIWRLGFAPKYPRDKIFEALRRFYDEMEINAFVAYETLGDFDLLLRLWIPKEYLLDDVELRLRQALEGCNLYGINYIACHTADHHAEDGPCDIQAAVDLVRSVEDDDLRAINDYNRAQAEAAVQVDEKFYAEEPIDDLPDIQRPTAANELLKAGALMSVPAAKRGIRFFVIFDHPRQPFRPETRDLTLEKLRTKCCEVRKKWSRGSDSSKFPQISIYEGNGTMSDFIVMARAPHGHFHGFVRDIVLGLREVDLDVLFEMRPYTHVIADRMFCDFQEARLLREALEPVDENTIQQEEDETLEFKATLSTDFRSYMATGKRERKSARVDDVVKAVCGLLNSPRPGRLVIGVLEVRREIEKRSDPSGYLEQLVEEFDYEFDPEKVPAVPNALIGIEFEFVQSSPLRDSDAYIGFLRDKLHAQIDPNPFPWTRIESVQIGERHVCVIATRPADVWFWGTIGDDKRESFFVREAASTRSYTGMESELYRRAHPRGWS
jgi:hypothetical protein